MPLITVIVSVYKRTAYLEAALRSVLGQTLADFELLVTDDADSPETRRICALFSGDARLRYRVNPRTLGVARNFGAALREARGTYVCFLNDDDLLYPAMLERLAAPLQADPGTVLAFGNHDIIDSAGAVLADQTQLLMRRRGRKKLPPGPLADSFSFAVRHNVMIGMGCLFRRAAADPAWLVPEVGTAYDYWLAIRLAERGPFFFVPEPVMAWRRHDDALTVRVAPDLFSAAIYILSALRARPLPPPLSDYVKRRLAGFLMRRAVVFRDQGWDRAKARRLLYRSWRTEWSALAFRRWLATFLPRKPPRPAA